MVAVVAAIGGIAFFGVRRENVDGDRGGADGRGGVLRIGLLRPASIDPAQATTVDEQILAEQLFDGLTAWDPRSGAPVAALAESWTVTDDGLSWTFTLRPTARFADGTPVRAADVELSLERVVAAGSTSSVQDLLEPLRDVTAEGDGVVRVDLKAPFAELASVLANPALGIVPSALARSGNFDGDVIGSGPFRFVSRHGDTLVLDAVPGGAAKVARLDVLLFDDVGASYDAFVHGHVDWSRVPSGKAAEAAARFGRRYFRPYVAELFYAFNLRNPKWADRRLREAVVRAVDRDRIVEDVYDGTVGPMNGFVGAGVPGAVPDACGACAHDVERARALVADVVSGGTALPEVAIDFDGDSTQTAVAESIERDLEAVGFTVTLRPRPLEDYETFAVSGGQDLFRLGWIPAYPAADAYLHPLFSSGSANNLAGFALTSVDEQLALARRTTDATARAALYQRAEQAILNELPVVPLAQFRMHAVASKRVRGLELGVMGTFDASTVTLGA